MKGLTKALTHLIKFEHEIAKSKTKFLQKAGLPIDPQLTNTLFLLLGYNFLLKSFDKLLHGLLYAIIDHEPMQVMKFKDAFLKFYRTNHKRFIDRKSKSNRPSLLGYRTKHQDGRIELYITTTAFRRFCKRHNFDPKFMIYALAKYGIAKRYTSKEYRHVKRLYRRITSFYRIDLTALEQFNYTPRTDTLKDACPPTAQKLLAPALDKPTD